MTPVGLALFGILLGTSPPADDERTEVRYIDASLEPEAELLGAEFVDVDLDGRLEVCLALRTADGGRELRLHRIEAERIPHEAFRVIPILDDALAFGFADVRTEPGRELFFLTRGGAWSYSLEHEGYRGNILRLAEEELIYDVPDPRALAYWNYVMPGKNGDRILLPGRAGYAIWHPKPDPGDGSGTTYEAGAQFQNDPSDDSRIRARSRGKGRRDRDDSGAEIALGPGGLVMVSEEQGTPRPFLSDLEDESGALLASGESYAAPALLDLNGDGRSDLVAALEFELHIHLADAEGNLEPEPTRVESYPDYLLREDVDLDLRFADLNGDPHPDLVVRLSEDPDGLENGVITLQFLINDGARLLPEKPHQIMRFEAAELRYHVTDVDGDGRPDLALREFELPSLIDTVTGLEFKLTHLLFTGEESGTRPFARKPALKQTETFDENTIQEAIKNRELALDHDGDGVSDMVEIDFEGRIAIRRLALRKGFFGGGTWSLEESPWRRFEVFGSIGSIEVRDLNGDGLGDIVSAGSEGLTILLSVRPGGGR